MCLCFLALLQQLQERSKDQDDRECLKQAITALLNLQSSVERIYTKHQPRRKPGYASSAAVYNIKHSVVILFACYLLSYKDAVIQTH